MVFRRNPTPPETEWKPTPEELKVRRGDPIEPFVKRLEECPSRESLEEEALRVALKVKLTLDKKAGEELEKAVRTLFR